MPGPEQIGALQLAALVLIFAILVLGSWFAAQLLGAWAYRRGQRRAEREVERIRSDAAQERLARAGGETGQPWAHLDKTAGVQNAAPKPIHAGRRAGLRGDFSGLGRNAS